MDTKLWLARDCDGGFDIGCGDVALAHVLPEASHRRLPYAMQPDAKPGDLARLFAAAPAMLAALELAEVWIDAGQESGETGEGQQARWILETIRYAIAAATGQEG
jgi:hypothetical protein